MPVCLENIFCTFAEFTPQRYALRHMMLRKILYGLLWRDEMLSAEKKIIHKKKPIKVCFLPGTIVRVGLMTLFFFSMREIMIGLHLFDMNIYQLVSRIHRLYT